MVSVCVPALLQSMPSALLVSTYTQCVGKNGNKNGVLQRTDEWADSHSIHS